ncbi:hypothetical protein [Spirillospora sp. CA-294931]|uniref:hypothetical protein n=1 Tax=Spirillospora sp. CA-294931 TaxID=3240042 RepID=UPI003D8EB53D
MNRIIATSTAVTVLCFGLSACNGDDGKKDAKSPGASSAAVTPASSTSPTSPTSAPTSAAPVEPSASPTPAAKPTDNSTVVLIEPGGKRWTRKKMIKMAMQMGMVMGSKLPANFCAKSYKESVARNAKFPAGREGFMSACQEGIDLGR